MQICSKRRGPGPRPKQDPTKEKSIDKKKKGHQKQVGRVILASRDLKGKLREKSEFQSSSYRFLSDPISKHFLSFFKVIKMPFLPHDKDLLGIYDGKDTVQIN